MYMHTSIRLSTPWIASMIDYIPKVPKSDLGQVSLNTKMSRPSHTHAHVHFIDKNVWVMNMQHYTLSSAPMRSISPLCSFGETQHFRFDGRDRWLWSASTPTSTTTTRWRSFFVPAHVCKTPFCLTQNARLLLHRTLPGGVSCPATSTTP